MKTRRRNSLSLKTCLALGCAVICAYAIGFVTAPSTNAAQEVPPPAYMVVSSKLLKPDEIGPYREAAGPLAQAAGIEILARRANAELLVLEGKWPYEEGITVERFRSMKALKDFWYSDGYQEAKKLREGVAKINFIIALEGVPASGE